MPRTGPPKKGEPNRSTPEQRAEWAEYRKKNRERMRATQRRYYIREKAKRPNPHGKLVGFVARVGKAHNSDLRAHSHRAKVAALNAYGKNCQCCGEQRLEFLSIDHVNGGGRAHRAKTGSGKAFYRKLRTIGFPQDPPLRVLCHNCNQSLGNLGYCPHNLGETL